MREYSCFLSYYINTKGCALLKTVMGITRFKYRDVKNEIISSTIYTVTNQQINVYLRKLKKFRNQSTLQEFLYEMIQET